MITKRIPALDDQRILRLVHQELIPLAHRQPKTFTRKDLRIRLREGSTYTARNSKGQCIGFLHLIIRYGRFWIDMLAVHPSYQGRGVGQQLLQQAEKKVIRRKKPHLTVLVDRKNERGLHFYERNGYQLMQYVKEIDCYLMEKKIWHKNTARL